MKHLLLSAMMIICAVAQSQTIMRIHQNNGTVLQVPINTIDSITYSNSNPGSLASISTLAIGNITTNSATSGGSINNDGGSPVTQRGICWATTQNPTTANNSAPAGSGTGSFTANLTGLAANTTYYVRAYAINTAGTAYGNQLSFTTTQIPFNPGSVTDASGNIYPTVTIGTQVWMAENLRTTKYSDGTDIPVISDNAIWANDAAEPKTCWFNNNATTYTENKFGALYNWYVIDPSTNGNKNVCPSGWHVPDENEWNILIAYLDPFSDPTATGAQSAVAGGKMKSTGTLYWLDPNTDATNASGFSALPGGLRGGDAVFFNAFSKGFWWSSSESTSALAWMRRLDNDNANVNRFEFSKDSGCSVRCIKDATP